MGVQAADMGVAGLDMVPVDPDKALAEVAVAVEPAEALAAVAVAESVAVAGQSRSRAYWNSLTLECMG